MPNERKAVRTELDRDEFVWFRERAEAAGVSVNEALRRAVIDWIARPETIAADDPLFVFHDDYAVPTSGVTDAADLEGELYDS